MKTKHLFAIALASAATAGTLTSCTNDEYHYNPNFETQQKLADYSKKFIEEFGDVSSVISWDWSDDRAQLATRAGTEEKIEQVAGLDFAVTNRVDVKTEGSGFNKKTTYTPAATFGQNEALYNNVKELLPDRTEHKGDVAVLTAPANSFTIYPVSAQGLYTYDLYVKVGDNEPTKVFSKTWTRYDKPYVNGMATECEDVGSKWVPKYEPCSPAIMPGIFIQTEVGTPIQVYITNIKSGDNVVTKKNLGTGSGNAIIINATAKPEGLDASIMPDNAVIKYIGIEDNEDLGDKDYNDLVLAIVGNPYTPQPIVIEEDEFTVDIAHPRKRYMIEDLGSYDDFDFNDLVVDVEDVVSQTYKATIVNGVMTSKEAVGAPKHQQKAYIRAMGGTYDFTLKIGSTTWTKSNHFNASNMYNTEKGEIDFDAPLAVINLKEDDWKYTNLALDNKVDNVVVTVLGNGTTPTYDITFGEAGKAPLMIAVDYITPWSAERENAEWIKQKMKK